MQSADVHVDVPSEELSEKRAALLKKAAAQKPSQDSWGLDTITKTKFSKATPKDKAVVAEQEKRERKRQNRRQRAREKAQHRERQKQEASSSRGGVEPNISVQSLEGGIGDVCLRFDNLTLDFGSATSLLDGASLRLLNAGKYGVVGKNGCGKSTLLNQLYNISLENQDSLGGIRVLYVAQEAEGTSKSAVQTVVDADTERTSLLKRESELIAELESSKMGDSTLADLKRVQEMLKQIGAESAEARASSILAGLQFSETMAKGCVQDLSGGWRMRLALATALFNRPDLLLLDEPSNHLDLHAIVWLQDYLSTKYSGTLLLVSHDTAFLDGVCNYTIHFNEYRKSLETFKGNYTYFCELKRQKVLAQQRAYEKQQQEIEHMQAFVDKWLHNKFGYNRGLVQSRIKFIERKKGDEKIDPPDPFDTELFLSFREPQDKVANPLIAIKDVSFRYPGSDRDLFVSANLKINRGSRIALVGANGAGKSTMLKLINANLEPDDGCVVRRGKLRVGFFLSISLTSLTWSAVQWKRCG